MTFGKSPKRSTVWNHDSAAEEASKYSSIADFQKGAGGAYTYAYRMKILDQICSHMDRAVRKKTSDEELKSEAEKYRTLAEFKEKAHSIFQAASRRRILEYVCSHMEEFKSPESKPLKVKKLSLEDKILLKDSQRYRSLMGLKPLEMRIRSCIACGNLFESIGNRTCGCTNGKTTNLTGLEVI